MGKAAVELPESVQAPSGAPASVDDLLSQLAGEEIDKLLSEAEAGEAPSALAPAEAPQEPATAPAPELAESQPLVAEVVPTAVPAAPMVEAVAVATPEVFEDSAATESEAPTSPDERAALEVAADPAADAADESTPWYLLPLEWLSAPLAACPDAMVEVLGKAALVTLFNAVAVLAYVVISRRHH